LTDVFTDGKPIRLFESGSIMQYLVERYDTEYKISYPKGTREWFEMNNWLFFQNAGVGPMQGQASKYQFFFLSRHLESEGGNMLWWRRDTVEAGTIQRTRRPQLVFTKERTNQDATRPIRESPLRAKQAET
jgi:glutathione S-transferase